MGEGFSPRFDRKLESESKPEPEWLGKLERTPDGHINNCAFANGDVEDMCQVCPGACPDRARFPVRYGLRSSAASSQRGKGPWLRDEQDKIRVFDTKKAALEFAALGGWVADVEENPPNEFKLSAWLAQRAQAVLDEHVRPEYQALAKRGNITPEETADLYANSWEWEHLTPAMNDEAFVARVEHALKNVSQHKRPFTTYDEAVQGLYAPELLRRFKAAQAEFTTVLETIGWLRRACEACGKRLVVAQSDGVPAIFCAACGGGCVSVEVTP